MSDRKEGRQERMLEKVPEHLERKGNVDLFKMVIMDESRPGIINNI